MSNLEQINPEPRYPSEFFKQLYLPLLQQYSDSKLFYDYNDSIELLTSNLYLPPGLTAYFDIKSYRALGIEQSAKLGPNYASIIEYYEAQSLAESRIMQDLIIHGLCRQPNTALSAASNEVIFNQSRLLNPHDPRYNELKIMITYPFYDPDTLPKQMKSFVYHFVAVTPLYSAIIQKFASDILKFYFADLPKDQFTNYKQSAQNYSFSDETLEEFKNMLVAFHRYKIGRGAVQVACLQTFLTNFQSNDLGDVSLLRTIQLVRSKLSDQYTITLNNNPNFLDSYESYSTWLNQRDILYNVNDIIIQQLYSEARQKLQPLINSPAFEQSVRMFAAQRGIEKIPGYTQSLIDFGIIRAES